MVTWMIHPLHGRTPAASADIELNKKNGWSVDPNQGKRSKLLAEEQAKLNAEHSAIAERRPLKSS